MSSFFSIGGLASGLDTGAIVDQLVALERRPLNVIANRRLGYQQIDAAWQSLVTRLSGVRTALDGLRAEGAVTSPTTATSSNDAVARVAVTGTPSVGSTQLTVDALASAHRIALGDTFSSADASFGSGSLTVTGGTGVPRTIVVEDGDTLADVARKLNVEGGVNAQVVRTGANTYRLVVASERTGADEAFTITSDLSELNDNEVLNQGADAQLRLGTLVVTRDSNTVTDLLDGVELRLTGVGEVTVGVERDLGASVDQVKKLVDAVNAALESVAQLGRTGTNPAERGALAGNSLLRTIGTGLRDVIASTVTGGDYATPSSIGISLTREGRLALDETKLREALGADPDAVSALIGFVAPGGEGAGLAGAFDRHLRTTEGSGGSIASARESLQARIRAADDAMEATESRIAIRERMLRAQFTGLETTLARLNTQGSWLMSQLGMMTAPQ